MQHYTNMKKYLLSISLLFITASSFCQINFPYVEVKLVKPSDYKQAEPLVLAAASALLSTPFKEKDTDRSQAQEFLKKWMEGTKDYTIQLSCVAQDIADDHDLFDLYAAATVKFILENKVLSANQKLVDMGACKLVLSYCDNPANNFKLKKKQRKKLEYD